MEVLIDQNFAAAGQSTRGWKSGLTNPSIESRSPAPEAKLLAVHSQAAGASGAFAI